MSTAVGPSERGPRWARWVGRFLAKGVWDTEVVAAHLVPAEGPVLLAANHTGLVDGPVLLGVSPRPSHMLVKSEMFWGPVGSVLRASGQIAVERDGGRSALTSALAVLKRGGVVGVFPEGNRGKGDAANARAGITWLALNAKAPVVPVAVLGTRRTGESVGHVPGLRRRLAIEFGEPLTIERTPGMSGRGALQEANEAIRVALADLVDRAQARTGIALPTDDPNRERVG
ncbi:lysophospholipid acyltransferase family protein [Cellulomonas fengjieae]|uniref:1-acyl-sn-glycerol-3-phosphate acyltransferase n=1 Tax=Cellulomonas fengjieae TaxID=2819978 RepID=A0ABS3SIV9_9CELL|nr:lysophospholipid acyltransferase family protein [Cellulomonas fengjieae]MBO3085693.1 1-acyl-sn-glycerol-3-phosphate acyltransferase [Cellulomonas fengjieae]QVI67593.1 1-acyl-sn-glycerol-3-phosphate acyltransferase [Cellulomonas fengjieae]